MKRAERRKLPGYCSECGQISTRKTCEHCTKLISVRVTRYKQRLKEAGRCIECRARLATGWTSRCYRCREANRLRVQDYRERKGK